MKSSNLRILSIAAIVLVGSAISFAAESGYHLLKTYKFGAAPGAQSEYFDYVTVDSAARRVYLGRGTAVQVLNADTGASLGFITGFQRQHGVAVAPEFGHGFITDGTDGTITIFDLKTLKKISDAKAQPDADCMLYDPASKYAFSMNGDSNSSTVVNAKTGEVVKNIPLGGSPEFAVADGKGKVFANLADKDQIAVIDTKTLEVTSRWPTGPDGHPTALAIDSEHHRLFSAGRSPQNLAIIDADNGKVIRTFPIAAGTDAARFDPATGLILVSTIAGEVDVFHEDSPDNYTALDPIKSEYGAKTMGLDTKTHEIFLDTADFNTPSAPTNGRGGRRMAQLGTFHVLVYGR
ncbi:MAG TPA: YncE family protein [Candidatus Binatia bacterium]|nr:YncE family protein [Candidatus Binatia bacterium]